MGRLLVLEGLDGSGKQTQTELLYRALQRMGVPVCRISFPDYAQPSSALVKMYLQGAFGSEPQDVNPYAASSFYAVDRFASYRRFWRNAYREGKVILADRYTTSNLVYQLPKLPKEEWPHFTQWLLDYEYHRLELPIPKLTLFLDMEPSVSQVLLEQRYGGSEQKKDIHERDRAFQQQCRAAAQYAAGRLGWKVVSCDAGGRLQPPESIHRRILQLVCASGILQPKELERSQQP